MALDSEGPSGPIDPSVPDDPSKPDDPTARDAAGHQPDDAEVDSDPADFSYDADYDTDSDADEEPPYFPDDDDGGRWRFRPITWVAIGVLTLIVLAIAWTGLKAWEIDHGLAHAERDVAFLKADLGAGRFSAFGPDTDRLQRDATSASSASHDPFWELTSHLPFVGANARAASVVSRSLNHVVQGALVPLNQSNTFGVISADNAGVANLMSALGTDTAPIAQAVAAIDKANRDIQTLHVGSLWNFVGRKVTSAQQKISKADTQIQDLSRLATVTPTLLGQERPQTLLLLFQTPAEERGTGGLVGAWGELRTDKGSVSLLDFGSLDSLAKVQTVPAGVNPEIATTYGNVIQVPQNFNVSASFPDAAQIFSTSWTTGPGHGVVPDAVLSIDPVALGHLLSATGPVKTASGLQLNASNAVDILLRQEYYTFPGTDQGPRVAFLGEVTRAVFAKLTKPGYSVGALGRKIAQSAGDGDLLVWSATPADQRQWVKLRVSGDLGSPTTAAGMGTVRLALNSLDGSKLGAYLTTTVDVTNTCTAGTTMKVTFRSEAPADIPFYAGTHVTGLVSTTMRLGYSLYVPPNLGVASITIGGTPTTFTSDHEGGWRLLRGSLDIPRQSSRVVTVQLTSATPGGQLSTVVVQPEAAPVTPHIVGAVTTNGSTCTP